MADQRDGGIAWTTTTWSPIRGCSRVDADCGVYPSPAGCYAEAIARRFSGEGLPYEGLVRLSKKTSKPVGWNGVVRLVEERLYDPLRWKEPRKIFVNAMSDLFHENLATEAIDRVLAVMLLAPHHTYQVLTKRSARMRVYFDDHTLYGRVLRQADAIRAVFPRKRLDAIEVSDPMLLVPSWIWLGVSCGHQAALDERVPDLLAVRASVRWVSQEPQWQAMEYRPEWLKRLSWIVQGGESGPRARFFLTRWATRTRDQCREAGTAYFLKQLGAHARTPNDDNFTIDNDPPDPDFPHWPMHLAQEDRVEQTVWPNYQGSAVRLRFRDRAGADPSEWRSDLRVREFPR